MDSFDYLEQVTDAKTFLTFARALVADRYVGRDWENETIEQFLECAIAWAETTKFGIDQGVPSSNLWQQFATFLYCGKIYE